MRQYLDLCQAILDNGVKTGDRTGTGTYTLPGYFYTCEMQQQNLKGEIKNYPLLTTKAMSFKSIFEELIWKLSGDTNIRFLVEHNNHIWTEWPFKNWLQETGQTALLKNMWKDKKKSDYTDEWKAAKKEFEQKILTDSEFCRKWGELGHTYGYQFRHFGEITYDDFDEQVRKDVFRDIDYHSNVLIKGEDQLMNAIDKIKNNPEDRRIIISLWNPKDEKKTLLPPCPCFYQFFANEPGKLHLNMYQRSCDTFLGVPYNTAQDALFLCMMAHVTGRKPGRFNHFFGDAHIYLNLVDQVKEQLTRTPHFLPSIKLNPDVKNILDFKFEDIELIGYEHDTRIKGAVSIWEKPFILFKKPREVSFLRLFYYLSFWGVKRRRILCVLFVIT